MYCKYITGNIVRGYGREANMSRGEAKCHLRPRDHTQVLQSSAAKFVEKSILSLRQLQQTNRDFQGRYMYFYSIEVHA